MQTDPAPATPRQKWRVLLVDDDPWMLRIMRASLSCFSRVVTCPSAEEALIALDREPFDVVCTDLVMPGMSGAELLRRVERSHRGAARLLVTGAEEHLSIEDRERHALLRKPFDPAHFASLIARLAGEVEGTLDRSKLTANGGDR
ncbi:MAG: response regulator [Polyangiaceae bacterium]